MRWMRFILILPLLLSTELAAQQYSEGACLLLQQQIDRFSEQRSNPNYRSARREYDKYCLNRNKTQPAVVKPAKQEPQQPVTSTPPQQSSTGNAAAAETSVPAKTPAPVVTPQTGLAEAGADTEVVKAVKSENTPEPVSSAVSKSEVYVEDAKNAEQFASPVNSVASTSVQNAPADFDSYPAADSDLLMQVLSSIPQLSALVFALLLLLFLLTSWLGFNLPGFKGVFAEYKLYRLLRWRLSKDYLHFRKLRLYTANDEPTLIDHLVLSRSGIFVIAVCSFRGNISGSVSMANWERQYLGNRKQFMNPLHQNFKNTEAVKHLLQLRGTEVMQHMHSVIAFTRLARFDAAIAENVAFIDDVSVYIKRFNESVISETEFARFAALLQQAESGQQR